MQDRTSSRGLWTVIAASSAGTMIEWYDFYIFGSLATILAPQFFPKTDETAALLLTLATFATGFLVRPFGALVFGHVGDVVGRKHAFLVTLIAMGMATFVIGLLPTYEQIGIAAPLALLVLRLIQGLALGGEYGGAATYVAEHAPDRRRGFYTSFIQTTATLGLLVSLLVILGTQNALGKEAFASWGWRVPFLLSAVLVVFSYVIRVRLAESPLFVRRKAAGETSSRPLAESFGRWSNLRLVLLALFGATMGQGVIWYTGQFYALLFMQSELKLSPVVVNQAVAVALVLGTPFFVVFGALSDRWGRKWIMMAGCLFGAVFTVPLFHALEQAGRAGSVVGIVAVVWVLVVFVTMVYGPIAAFLVELFPTRVRYTSMSLPYHIGNGVFGGLVPVVATQLVAQTGNRFAGLYYPVTIAAVTVVVGTLLLPDRRNVPLDV